MSQVLPLQGNLAVPEFLISTEANVSRSEVHQKSVCVCVSVPSWRTNTHPKIQRFSHKWAILKGNFIFQPLIFRGYFSFRDDNLSTLKVFLKMIFSLPFWWDMNCFLPWRVCLGVVQSLFHNASPLVRSPCFTKVFRCWYTIYTLSETNSLPLKMDGWNTILLGYFQGATVDGSEIRRSPVDTSMVNGKYSIIYVGFLHIPGDFLAGFLNHQRRMLVSGKGCKASYNRIIGKQGIIMGSMRKQRLSGWFFCMSFYGMSWIKDD